jgi:hypothetical protein
MALLYDIIKKKQLKQYPPLPQWVLDTVKVLEKINDQDRYFEFTQSIIFDPETKTWTRTTND